ncbi:glycosyltransferase [Acinetobacter sp. ANC 4635]|uniref:glycosyltransferase n=1 Tax=Acinetobacter sp. ANC 4635 TaxID=2529846 RepID=UPI00103B8994|nr:glycosyltransferase [Acinetobacter sp. ANC 4635]TCB32836.1 glycosyltransferase [Acinetobacter sp. ANC 4635]
MKIVHIQSLVSKKSTAPHRLHKLMLESGYDSKIVTFNSEIKNDKILALSTLYYKFKRRVYDFFLKNFFIKILGLKTKLYSYNLYFSENLYKLDVLKEADVIYLHWINNGFLNLKDLDNIIKLNKKTFIFLHDMWHITGGCHHAFECQKYTTNCIECPVFENDLNIPHKQLVEKERIYKNLIFIAPSLWMYNKANQSIVSKYNIINIIPNYIDENKFFNMDKIESRKILKLDLKCKYILFGCVGGISNKIKGWEFLYHAINSLSLNLLNNTKLLIYGTEYSEEIKKLLNIEVIFLGEIYDETKMMLLYNAVDVFAAPSLAESFGMTVLESLMCGTPVVTFETVGSSEFIVHKVNGFLAKYKNIQSLHEGLEFCLTNNLSVGVDNKYSRKHVVELHFNLINEINL